jgi:hypothetical protein
MDRETADASGGRFLRRDVEDFPDRRVHRPRVGLSLLRQPFGGRRSFRLRSEKRRRVGDRFGFAPCLAATELFDARLLLTLEHTDDFLMARANDE